PGQIGDGVVEPKEHTVAMIQTVANAFKIKTDDDDLEEKDKTRLTEQRINILKNAIFRTECMIGDECHGLVSKTWYSIQKYFTNVYYKFGFSATPAKTDKSDLLLEATFGPKIVDIPCTELINKGYLAKPIFYLIRFKHERIPRILSYQELYDQEIVCNENRNFLIVKLGTKFWKEGKRILIIVQQVKHGKILEEMFKITIGKENVRFIQGITKSEMRQRVLEDLNKGNIRLVIATKVFSEGIDCPEINVLMNVKCQISYVDFVQIIGRAMRKTENKDKTCIIDIYDYGCRYLERHSKERLSILKTEPEFDIRMIDESKI
ncbi:MAG: helicase-related protein, partial [Nitrososphaerota archaeon]